jgi:hypothetical protein
MNLHDWVDELCDVLDIEVEFDEALLLDVAREAAHQVERPAAPLTTFLLGYASGVKGLDEEGMEALAARALQLAERWDRPADAPDEVDVDDEVPDDSGVDHSDDEFED